MTLWVKVTCVDGAGQELGTVEVEKGTVLLSALQEFGFAPGPCGGYGSCGGCIVELADGRLVQSCFFCVNEDLVVLRRTRLPGISFRAAG